MTENLTHRLTKIKRKKKKYEIEFYKIEPGRAGQVENS